MPHPESFSAKLKAGWTQDELMKYYALSEAQFQRILESLERITQAQAQNAKKERRL